MDVIIQQSMIEQLANKTFDGDVVIVALAAEEDEAVLDDAFA